MRVYGREQSRAAPGGRRTLQPHRQPRRRRGTDAGHRGARQFAATFRQAFPDLENTIDDMVAEGDKVVVRFKARGAHDGETEAFGEENGAYEVLFDQTVRACAYTATIGISGVEGSKEPGEITVAGHIDATNGVFVSTHDSAGNLA